MTRSLGFWRSCTRTQSSILSSSFLTWTSSGTSSMAMHRRILYLWTWLRCVDCPTFPYSRCFDAFREPVSSTCTRCFHTLHCKRTCPSSWSCPSPDGVYHFPSLSNPYLHRDMPMNNHDGRSWTSAVGDIISAAMIALWLTCNRILKVPFSVPHSPCHLLRQILCAIDVGAFFLALLRGDNINGSVQSQPVPRFTFSEGDTRRAE